MVETKELPFVARRPVSLAARSTAALLLLAFVVQAAIATREDSVTVDEFVPLPVGLSMLREKTLAVNLGHAPLSPMILALPLWPDTMVSVPAYDARGQVMGLAFLNANVDRYHGIFVRSRCVVILLAVLLGMLVYRWAVELHGPPAGVVAVLLFAFSPSLLARGHVATEEITAAFAFTASVYAWWRYLDQRSPWRAIVAGLTAGIGLLLDFSVAILGVVLIVTLWIELLAEARGARLRALASLALGGILFLAAAVVAIDAVYSFGGLDHWVSDLTLPAGGAIAQLRSYLPDLPLPLPSSFVASLDLATTMPRSARQSLYLAGVFSSTAWWYYDFVAFAVKTSLPIAVAAGLVMLAGLAGRMRGRSRYVVVIAALAVFAVRIAFPEETTGMRSTLAAELLLLVLIAPLFAEPIRAVVSGDRTLMQMAGALVGVCALVWVVAGTVRVAPRYIEYFNEAAGGPSNGRRWLADSNLDAGQDLVRLERYAAEHDRAAISIAYMGPVHPRAYGIRFAPLTRESRGRVVISASTLMGSTAAIWSDEARRVSPTFDTFSWLRDKEPAGQVGSMVLFDLR